MTQLKDYEHPKPGDVLYRSEIQLDEDGTTKTYGLFTGIVACHVPRPTAEKFISMFDLHLNMPNMHYLPSKPLYWFTQYGWDLFQDAIAEMETNLRAFCKDARIIHRTERYDPEKHVLHYYDDHQVVISMSSGNT